MTRCNASRPTYPLRSNILAVLCCSDRRASTGLRTHRKSKTREKCALPWCTEKVCCNIKTTKNIDPNIEPGQQVHRRPA